MSLIEQAQAAQAARQSVRKPIDYDRMRKVFPQQKAALTRAVKTKDPDKVAAECVKAIKVWNEIGAWPDDWSRWQRALNDLLPWHASVDLDDLPLD